ncbi:dnaJ homolog subfamily C member 8 [Hyposmocoma kahamanoa]|uniref:dnaJ homolog subfamily C member 8 n=1 Tax=Hyposmocoma kahamanoa TaxID=1477025 RepID=UPI000E6D7E74|nr:dnaJ homolog subfamily C member 8 [Hyposmocoma kahamanoa]
MSSSSAMNDPSFDEFYTEVKEIEKRDSVLTPKQQIDRLLRPGSTYFNLNPFEVLQLEPECTLEEIKKKYRRLSILVHPDKNMEDLERAQQAFEIVNRAFKTLENDDTRKKCLDIYQEAKERTEHMESRQNRVDSWKTFQSGGGKEKKKKKIMGFKPPKPKPESR